MFLALQTPLIEPGRDLLGIGADVALVLLGIFAVVGSILAVVLLFRVLGATRELRNGVRSLQGKADPVFEHGRGIAANVEFITAALRTDVEQLNASVTALSGRLQQASDRMEERIEEFNALMEVVQGEAEGVFLDTAATVRGVRASAEHLVAGESSTGAEDTELLDVAEDATDEREIEPVEARAGSEPGA